MACGGGINEFIPLRPDRFIYPVCAHGYVLVITFEGGQYGIYGPRVDCYSPSVARPITVIQRAINPILLD